MAPTSKGKQMHNDSRRQLLQSMGAGAALAALPAIAGAAMQAAEPALAKCDQPRAEHDNATGRCADRGGDPRDQAGAGRLIN
jgi:hypothetical protein